MVVGSTSSVLCVNFFTRTELGGPSHGIMPKRKTKTGGGGGGAGVYLGVVESRGRRGGGDLNGGGIHFVSTLCELLYQDRTSCT